MRLSFAEIPVLVNESNRTLFLNPNDVAWFEPYYRSGVRPGEENCTRFSIRGENLIHVAIMEPQEFLRRIMGVLIKVSAQS